MRVWVDGRLGFGVTAKDLALDLIAAIGAAGGTGHVLEYAGPAVRALSMEARMTLCNMAIEAGSRAGMIAPDETTYAYLEGRPFAPRGDAWGPALAAWRALPTDPDARFDREIALDASVVVPMVTWGTSPEDALPITGRVPDPSSAGDPVRRASLDRALAYMGLVPGTALDAIPSTASSSARARTAGWRTSARRRRSFAGGGRSCPRWPCPARVWCGGPPKPRVSTGSSGPRASSGASPAVRCAWR